MPFFFFEAMGSGITSNTVSGGGDPEDDQDADGEDLSLASMKRYIM